MYSIVTNDKLVSPVFENELADWARLDSDDPTIKPTLIIATSLVIKFLRLELLNREYTLIHDDWPTVGTNTFPSISVGNLYYKQNIELPYTNLASITSVKVNEEVTTDYRTVAGLPYHLEFDSVPVYDEDKKALEVVYTAGFGALATDVPEEIRTAILMVGAYIAMHRGGCDTGNAVSMSGASVLLEPYAVRGGIAL